MEGAGTGGAMHQVADRGEGIRAVEFGFDLEKLYIRVDGTAPMDELLAGGFSLGLRFGSPIGLRMEVDGAAGGMVTFTLYRKSAEGLWAAASESRLRGAVGRVAEFEIPFAVLGASAGERVAMFVLLRRGTADVDRQPRHQAIEFEVPDHRFAARTWTA